MTKVTLDDKTAVLLDALTEWLNEETRTAYQAGKLPELPEPATSSEVLTFILSVYALQTFPEKTEQLAETIMNAS